MAVYVLPSYFCRLISHISYSSSWPQLKADEESGRRGYTLTFMIAYLRDIVMDYSFIAESFGTHFFCFNGFLLLILAAETSVSYKDALKLCDSVKKKIKDSCLALGVCAPPFVCCRITQVCRVLFHLLFFFLTSPLYFS